MLNCTETAVLIRRVYDPDTDTETEQVLPLCGVSIAGGSAVRAGKGGLSGTGSWRVRVPAALLEGLPEGWQLPADSPAGCPVRVGDSIRFCGGRHTVLAVRDNWQRRIFPHLLLEVE